ncbi:MAG: helix-turn-helix domain-containing protein [Pseudomonadota bacterium]
MARAATYDRDEVLRKARDLFWSKGYRGTSLKDLEAALDLRPGSIYAGFGSKEALFSEALRLYAEESRRAADETFARHASPLAGLAAYARALAGLCDPERPSRACMVAKTVLETADDDPVLRDLAERLMDVAETSFVNQFRAAQAAGEIDADADPVRLGRRFQAGVIGIRAYAQRRVAQEAVASLADDLAAEIEGLRLAPGLGRP